MAWASRLDTCKPLSRGHFSTRRSRLLSPRLTVVKARISMLIGSRHVRAAIRFASIVFGIAEIMDALCDIYVDSGDSVAMLCAGICVGLGRCGSTCCIGCHPAFAAASIVEATSVMEWTDAKQNCSAVRAARASDGVFWLSDDCARPCLGTQTLRQTRPF